MPIIPIRTEPASSEDVPAMVELLSILFSIEQDFSPAPQKQERGLRLLLQDQERSAVRVARTADRVVVGMVTAQLVISTAEGAWSAWVEDMVVHPDYQGQGVGGALLESLLYWAGERGATRAQLLVDMDNLPAVGYYGHLGWQPTRLNAHRLCLRPGAGY